MNQVPVTTNGSPAVSDENPFKAKAAEAAVRPVKSNLLATVTTGKKVRPIFCVIYGPPGIGKSTFASQAPAPIFLDVERGVDQLDVARFPQPKTYGEFAQQLNVLDIEEHPYKTIVIDTFDVLDSLIQKRACDDLKVESIDQPSHGAGYTYAKTLWRRLMVKLNAMSERFNIIMIGHASVVPFNDPALPAPYDTWKFRINQKCGDAIRETVDTILYACLDVTVRKDKVKDVKGHAVTSGERVMHGQPATGFESKNRFNLPDPLPLEWAALEQAVSDFYAK